MKRKVLIGLLAFGTVAGYAAGCARIAHHKHHRHHAFEHRVADVCAAAAHRVYSRQDPSAPAAHPPPSPRWHH